MRITHITAPLVVLAVLSTPGCMVSKTHFSQKHQYQLLGWGTTIPGKEAGGLQTMRLAEHLKLIPPHASNGELEIVFKSGVTKNFPCRVTTEFIRNVVNQDKNGKVTPIGDIQNWNWEAIISINQPISSLSVRSGEKEVNRISFASPIFNWQ